MKTKITSIVAVLVALATGYVISHPIIFHICSNIYQFKDYIGCLDSSIKDIGFPLFIFSSWTLFVVIVMAFIPQNIFISWLKFAAWMIPLLFILIATQPVVSGFLSTNRDDAARLAGEVFSVISLILIIWKYSATRRLFSQKT